MRHFYIRKAGILLAKAAFLLCGLGAIWMMLSLVEAGWHFPLVAGDAGQRRRLCSGLCVSARRADCGGRAERGHGPGKAGACPQDRPEAQRMSAPDKEPQPLGSTSGKRGYIRTWCALRRHPVRRGPPGKNTAPSAALRSTASGPETTMPETPTKSAQPTSGGRRPPGHRSIASAADARSRMPLTGRNGVRTA